LRQVLEDEHFLTCTGQNSLTSSNQNATSVMKTRHFGNLSNFLYFFPASLLTDDGSELTLLRVFQSGMIGLVGLVGFTDRTGRFKCNA